MIRLKSGGVLCSPGFQNKSASNEAGQSVVSGSIGLYDVFESSAELNAIYPPNCAAPSTAPPAVRRFNLTEHNHRHAGRPDHRVIVIPADREVGDKDGEDELHELISHSEAVQRTGA